VCAVLLAPPVLLLIATGLCNLPPLAWATAGCSSRSHSEASGGTASAGRTAAPKTATGPVQGSSDEEEAPGHARWRLLAVGLVSVAVLLGTGQLPVSAESALVRSKIRMGGASTLDGGSRKTITRGMNLDGADYSKQDLSGVSFQQSILRAAKFKDANLVGASFFDADLAGSDFTGADMTRANLELARLTDAIFTNTVANGMYVNGTTKMEPANIDGADFTDSFFRKDQLQYLCKIATGTNPITKVDTRESLMCPE